MKVRPKKWLGQNFLKSPPHLDRIVEGARLDNDDLVLEIGPGQGDLTARLLENAGHVIAIETDSDLIPLLRERFSTRDNLTLIHDDALTLDWEKLAASYGFDKRMKLVANIPYYITTPILKKSIESRRAIESCVLTVQLEMAKRIVAPPGSKDYGSISILIRYFAEVEMLFTIPPGAFSPPPKVRSAVIRMVFRDKPPVSVADEALFFKAVRAGFQQRRKMIRNSLRSLGIDDAVINLALERAGISPEIRAERLDIDDFGRLSDELHEML